MSEDEIPAEAFPDDSVAEAEEPVPADNDDEGEVEAAEEEILGATPAEVEDEPEPELNPEEERVAAARQRIRDLLDAGVKFSNLEVLTNSRGEPVAVRTP